MYKRLFHITRIRRSFSTHDYKGVVGLEVHAQLSSKSKLFSAAPNKFNAPVNSCVADFDAAIPGTLPVLNRFCVECAVKIALVMHCDINKKSTFDRKHYFYSDLPAGYQITQQVNPIAKNGFIEFPMIEGKKVVTKKSKLHQIQLEQDSGKSLHDEVEKKVLIDLNRAGAPLVEFVFCPDLENGEQAAALVKELCLLLTTIKVCSCKMEEGALRVDANVSVHRTGEPFGTRTEVKNIGSISGISQAVNFEIKRQIEVLGKGERIINETRTWDAVKHRTIPMRDKEVVLDYRFMPEPNLLPVHLTTDEHEEEDVVSITKLAKQIPELPSQSRTRLVTNHKLTPNMALLIVDDSHLLLTFDKILSRNPNRNPQVVANILINSVRKICNLKKCDIQNLKLTPEKIGQVVDLLEQNVINLNFMQRLLEALDDEMTKDDETAESIVDKNDWKQILDDDVIEKVCVTVIENNPKLVDQFRKGKEKLFYALVGLVAKEMDGKINMTKATKILKSLLSNKN